jgi:hypothetical protein
MRRDEAPAAARSTMSQPVFRMPRSASSTSATVARPARVRRDRGPNRAPHLECRSGRESHDEQGQIGRAARRPVSEPEQAVNRRGRRPARAPGGPGAARACGGGAAKCNAECVTTPAGPRAWMRMTASDGVHPKPAMTAGDFPPCGSRCKPITSRRAANGAYLGDLAAAFKRGEGHDGCASAEPLAPGQRSTWSRQIPTERGHRQLAQIEASLYRELVLPAQSRKYFDISAIAPHMCTANHVMAELWHFGHACVIYLYTDLGPLVCVFRLW